MRHVLSLDERYILRTLSVRSQNIRSLWSQRQMFERLMNKSGIINQSNSKSRFALSPSAFHFILKLSRFSNIRVTWHCFGRPEGAVSEWRHVNARRWLEESLGKRSSRKLGQQSEANRGAEAQIRGPKCAETRRRWSGTDQLESYWTELSHTLTAFWYLTPRRRAGFARGDVDVRRNHVELVPRVAFICLRLLRVGKSELRISV